jgi:membrane protein DedA with SNARE-associated domain
MIAQALLASIAIILLSFISEDAATISSALSTFGGPVSWPLGFAACFAGIWLGDLGLYSLARWLGKPILQSRWIARFANAAAIERCEKKFNQRGSLALLASRFVPGTRLPTYLAAGLLSMPLTRFALVTASAALLWIGGIFAMAKLLGSKALFWLSFLQGRIAAIAFTALLVGAALFLFRKLGHAPAWVRRWTHWEFWPAWLFYIPVGAYYVWLAIRYHSFSLPTSANPGIATGGFIGESKYEILQQLRQTDTNLVADAYLIEGSTTTDRLLSLHRVCYEHKLTLPFILKPDIGQRGNGVRLICSLREAFEYLSELEAPLILQRYVAGPYEVGVFYYRLPGESRGQIFSITEKLFPTITGDGVRTVAQLVLADPRASLISRRYLRRFAERKNEILPEGEVLKLVETGNHAQGCIFRDGDHLWSKALVRRIDNISRSLPGFYIGRYDIRYDNERDFRDGRNFKVVELNGASSEATSIYDARTSLRSAYRVLFRQWRLVFTIGAANRACGCTPDSVRKLWQEWRRYSRLAVSYPLAS